MVNIIGKNLAEYSTTEFAKGMLMTRLALGRRDAPRLPFIAAALVLALGACAPGLGSGDYSRGQVGAVNQTDRGTVVAVRQVRIEGTKSGVGSGAGAALGGVGGAALGQGRVSTAIGAIGGAVIGGVAGAAAEEGLTRQVGHEYTVRRSNGSVVTIVQAAEGNALPPGSPVLILFGDRARVIPDTTFR